MLLCGLTFELSRPRRRTPAGHARTIPTLAWSGQTVAAVAGRRLERGVRPHLCLLNSICRRSACWARPSETCMNECGAFIRLAARMTKHAVLGIDLPSAASGDGDVYREDSAAISQIGPASE